MIRVDVPTPRQFVEQSANEADVVNVPHLVGGRAIRAVVPDRWIGVETSWEFWIRTCRVWCDHEHAFALGQLIPAGLAQSPRAASAGTVQQEHDRQRSLRRGSMISRPPLAAIHMNDQLVHPGIVREGR